MNGSPTKGDYENLRNARILENQARLASLGLQKTIHELRSLTFTPVRPWRKKMYSGEHLRRSERLRAHVAVPGSGASLRRSDRLKRKCSADSVLGEGEISHLRRTTRLKRVTANSIDLKGSLESSGEKEESSCKEDKRSLSARCKVLRPANKPLLKIQKLNYQLSPEDSARRCNSKRRGTVYDPVFGITCHFCRQKTLCSEEDCKRCSKLDMDQPCIGKTDCSVCHSSLGVLCRGCLKVRYGEEMEEVRENKQWMCPHCVEGTGSSPYWICNSSICLKKRNMVPTGIAVFRAQEMGYKSVAHLLMDELQRKRRILRTRTVLK